MSNKDKAEEATAGTTNLPAVVNDDEAQERFTKRLKTFEKSINTSKSAIREASEIALQHFEKHGDTSLLQRCLDSVETHGKNFVRVAALKMWMRDHSPLTMVDGKLVKDVSEDANKFNIEAALKTPFWDYAPDTEQVQFTASDIVTALKHALNKFKNEKKYKPADEAAKAEIAKAERAVAGL